MLDGGEIAEGRWGGREGYCPLKWEKYGRNGDHTLRFHPYHHGTKVVNIWKDTKYIWLNDVNKYRLPRKCRVLLTKCQRDMKNPHREIPGMGIELGRNANNLPEWGCRGGKIVMVLTVCKVNEEYCCQNESGFWKKVGKIRRGVSKNSGLPYKVPD